MGPGKIKRVVFKITVDGATRDANCISKFQWFA